MVALAPAEPWPWMMSLWPVLEMLSSPRLSVYVPDESWMVSVPWPLSLFEALRASRNVLIWPPPLLPSLKVVGVKMLGRVRSSNCSSVGRGLLCSAADDRSLRMVRVRSRKRRYSSCHFMVSLRRQCDPRYNEKAIAPRGGSYSPAG